MSGLHRSVCDRGGSVRTYLRSQIATRGGREKGSGIAFAGLILGYAELAFFAVILVVALSVFRNVKREFDITDPRTRAALLDRIAHGDPNEVTPEKSARHTETAIDTLRYLRGDDYFSSTRPGIRLPDVDDGI